MSRTLREVDPLSGTDEPKGELTQVLRDRLRGRVERGKGGDASFWFWCATVAVRSDDGMSWSAESAAQAIRRTVAHFRFFPLLPPSPEGLPAIAALIDERAFLRRVVGSGLVRGFLPLRPAARWALWASVLVLSVLLKLADVGLGERLVAAGAPATVLELGLFLSLFGGLSLLLHELLIRLSTREDRTGVRELRGEIEKAKEPSQVAYGLLVEGLVDELRRGPFPRALVVDDFHRLDELTRDVLLRYLASAARRRSGTEAWIVFERWTAGLSHQIVAGPHAAELLRHCTLFRQAPLDPDERRRLAEAVGRPERARQPTVKLICRGADAALIGEYADLLRAFRRDRPRSADRYDEIDLLYLLELNARGGYGTLEHSFVEKTCSAKEGLTADLLRSLLPGTDLRKEEIDLALRRIEETFAETPLLGVDAPTGRRALTVHPVGAFDGSAGDLRLLPEGLGHAFWCVFWGNGFLGGAGGGDLGGQPLPRQASWIRKLAFHLLASDVGAVPAALRSQAIERTTLVLLYVLEGAVHTCVYEPLPDLLRLAALRADDLAERPGLLRRLREACWNAYLLTGAEEALAAYVKTLRPDAPGDEPDDPLIRLFLDTVPVEESGRRRLARVLFAPETGGRELLAVYARQRAIALVSALAAFGLSLDGLTIAGLPGRVPEALATDAARIEERVSATPSEQLDALELLCLRWLLDNLGLEYYETVRARGPWWQLGLDESAEVELSLHLLDRLLALAETAVLLTAQLDQALRRSLGAELVRAALIRDLGAVAMINVRLAAEALGTAGLERLDDERLRRVRGIADVLFAAAGLAPIAIERPVDLLAPALTRQVDRLGSLASFVFHQFELGAQAILAETRRTALVVFSRGAAEGWRSSEPLRVALDQARTLEPLVEILAHLRIARCFSFSSELRADYFLRAAAVVLDQPLGRDLQRDVSLLSLEVAHHLELDLSPAVRYLVERKEPGGASLLDRHLADPAVEGEGLAMRLVNVARRSPPELRDAVQAALRSRAAAGDAGAVAIGRLLELEVLREELARPVGAARVDAILDAWQAHRDGWTYAALLSWLLTARSDGRVISEALAVLAAADLESTYSAYVNLAHLLSVSFEESGRDLSLDEQPLDYLRRGLPFWEVEFPASWTANGYRVLCRALDPPPPELTERVIHWTRIQLQHEEAAQVMPLLRKQSFFRLFLYYVDFFRGWGLPFDRTPDEVHVARNLLEQERASRFDDWVRGGGEARSLVAGDRGISTFTLAVGEDLFRPPLAAREQLSEARRNFDLIARYELPRLLSLGRSLLPPDLRELLQAHERRFETFGPPAAAAG